MRRIVGGYAAGVNAMRALVDGWSGYCSFPPSMGGIPACHQASTSSGDAQRSRLPGW